ncbi:MAG: hypothetical protein QM674_06015 [Burkholderiaceae bacterium]
MRKLFRTGAADANAGAQVRTPLDASKKKAALLGVLSVVMAVFALLMVAAFYLTCIFVGLWLVFKIVAVFIFWNTPGRHDGLELLAGGVVAVVLLACLMSVVGPTGASGQHSDSVDDGPKRRRRRTAAVALLGYSAFKSSSADVRDGGTGSVGWWKGAKGDCSDSDG